MYGNAGHAYTPGLYPNKVLQRLPKPQRLQMPKGATQGCKAPTKPKTLVRTKAQARDRKEA